MFYHTLSDAQNGSLNLSRFVRMLIRCLFTDDELVVGSIKLGSKFKFPYSKVKLKSLAFSLHLQALVKKSLKLNQLKVP